MTQRTKRHLVRKFGTTLNELGKLTFAGLVLADIILGSKGSQAVLIAGTAASICGIGLGIFIETLFEEEK
jgi:hypothetical protein